MASAALKLLPIDSDAVTQPENVALAKRLASSSPAPTLYTLRGIQDEVASTEANRILREVGYTEAERRVQQLAKESKRLHRQTLQALGALRQFDVAQERLYGWIERAGGADEPVLPCLWKSCKADPEWRPCEGEKATWSQSPSYEHPDGWVITENDPIGAFCIQPTKAVEPGSTISVTPNATLRTMSSVVDKVYRPDALRNFQAVFFDAEWASARYEALKSVLEIAKKGGIPKPRIGRPSTIDQDKLWTCAMRFLTAYPQQRSLWRNDGGFYLRQLAKLVKCSKNQDCIDATSKVSLVTIEKRLRDLIKEHGLPEVVPPRRENAAE